MKKCLIVHEFNNSHGEVTEDKLHMDSHDGIHIIQKDFHDDYDDLEVGHLFGIIIKKYIYMHFSLLKNQCFQ
jgi:hypothetical protein